MYFDQVQQERDNFIAKNPLKVKKKAIDKYTSNYIKEEFKVNGSEAKYMNNFMNTQEVGAFNEIAGYAKRDILRGEGKWAAGAGLSQGYGFGFVGSFKAGRASDAASLLFDTPMVAKEATLNAMGIMTKQQKLQAASGGVMGKVMGGMVPFSAAAFIGSGMYDGEDPFSIAQNQMVSAAGFTGAIAGIRAGGILAPTMKNGVVKGLGRVAGGVIGGATGAGLTYGITESVRDITSAESFIGKTAYKMASREYFADTMQTQATLTARQKALQQVNSSVLNDRGFTLGNEASILKNVSL